MDTLSGTRLVPQACNRCTEEGKKCDVLSKELDFEDSWCSQLSAMMFYQCLCVREIDTDLLSGTRLVPQSVSSSHNEGFHKEAR